MSDVIVSKYDNVYLKIKCADAGIARDLSDYFTFRVPGYQFMPSYKSGYWDGNIRLYNINTGLLYYGLYEFVNKFAKSRKYSIFCDYDNSDENISLVEVDDWITKQKFSLIPRDYQIDAFVHAIRSGRQILKSPTASGKSFIIYMILRWYLRPSLIIVPTTQLIHQMYSDFEEYGFKSSKYIHKIYAGQDKNTDKPIVISTWQSIYKLQKKWFEKYDVIVGDEVHLFKAKSLSGLMEKTTKTKYKFGTTGTLDDSQTHELVLTGLFGPVYNVTTTKKLMDEGHVSKFHIKIICLKHSDENKKLCSSSFSKYKDEMDFITSYKPRNEFITNLSLSLTGNSLILFRYKKHGKLLYDMIVAKDPLRKVYFIDGSVEGEDRDKIRKILESEEDAILIASDGTTSTGTNIKRLKNLIFASPNKSKIKNLQSIGRSLRTSEHYEDAVLYDISDDLMWKKRINHTLRHLIARIKIYDNEQFTYKHYNVGLK